LGQGWRLAGWAPGGRGVGSQRASSSERGVRRSVGSQSAKSSERGVCSGVGSQRAASEARAAASGPKGPGAAASEACAEVSGPRRPGAASEARAAASGPRGPEQRARGEGHRWSAQQLCGTWLNLKQPPSILTSQVLLAACVFSSCPFRISVLAQVKSRVTRREVPGYIKSGKQEESPSQEGGRGVLCICMCLQVLIQF
jgi:hypothetical protein